MKIIALICMAGCMLFACRSSRSDVALTGTKWVLESLEGQKVEMKVANNEIVMQFNDGEKRVTGMAGCNRFFGGYEMDGNKLKFSHMGPAPTGRRKLVSLKSLKVRMLFS